MCVECRCNSLADNKLGHLKMLGMGIVDFKNIPRLVGDAENAERAFQRLMKSEGWTPEELFEITGYRILAPQNKFAI